MINFAQEFLNLTEVKVVSYKIQNDAIYIQVESKKSEIPSKKCGKLTRQKGVDKEIRIS